MVRTCTIERVPVSYPQKSNAADQASNTLQPHNPNSYSYYISHNQWLQLWFH